MSDGEIVRSDGHGAAVGHGITSIDNQVDNDLLDTVGIYFTQSNMGLKKRSKFNIAAQQRFQHRFHGTDRGVEI